MFLTVWFEILRTVRNVETKHEIKAFSAGYYWSLSTLCCKLLGFLNTIQIEGCGVLSRSTKTKPKLSCKSFLLFRKLIYSFQIGIQVQSYRLPSTYTRSEWVLASQIRNCNFILIFHRFEKMGRTGYSPRETGLFYWIP